MSLSSLYISSVDSNRVVRFLGDFSVWNDSLHTTSDVLFGKGE